MTALLSLAAVLGWTAPGPAGRGLALLSLATIPAIFAVPPRGRPWIGGGVVIIGGAAAALGDLGDSWRAWASVGILVVAGALTAFGGSSWPGLSRRYGHRPTDPVAADDAGADSIDLWRSLDRGEDPTARDDAPEPGIQQTPPKRNGLD